MTANAVPTTEILNYLNPVFRILGGDDIGGLPKGIPGNPDECVIARAFEQATGRAVTVGTCKLSVYFESDAKAISRNWLGGIDYTKSFDCDGTRCYDIRMPTTLIEFIDLFDREVYAELIDGWSDDVMQVADTGLAATTDAIQPVLVAAP